MKTEATCKKPKLGTWPRLQVAPAGEIVLMQDPFDGTVIHGPSGTSIGYHYHNWIGLKDYHGSVTISSED
jgi:hypothetical protein